MVLGRNIGSFSTIAANLRPQVVAALNEGQAPPPFLPEQAAPGSLLSILRGTSAPSAAAAFAAPAAAAAAPAAGRGPFGLPWPVVIGGGAALVVGAYLLLRRR